MSRYRALRVAAVILGMAALAAVDPAAAGEKPVKIGIMPSGTVKALLEMYQPLMEYLSRKTGRPFEVHPATSYVEILGRMKSGENDGGVVGSLMGSEAVYRGDVVPVARPEKGSVSSYRGYLIARKDGGANRVEDLKGKSFDSNPGSAAISHFFPRKLLKDRKLAFDTFFSRVTTSSKHDAVVYKVLNKEADCGAVKDTVFDKLSMSDERVKAELVILATSQPFPDGNLMFGKATSAELLKATRQALLGLEKDPEGKSALGALGVDRFIPAPVKEYEQLGKASHALEKK